MVQDYGTVKCKTDVINHLLQQCLLAWQELDFSRADLPTLLNLQKNFSEVLFVIKGQS